MITKLEFAKKVRAFFIEYGAGGLCHASYKVYKPLQHRPACHELRDAWYDYDNRVKTIAEAEGASTHMYYWPLDKEGHARRIAVCDHIINELEQA